MDQDTKDNVSLIVVAMGEIVRSAETELGGALKVGGCGAACDGAGPDATDVKLRAMMDRVDRATEGVVSGEVVVKEVRQIVDEFLTLANYYEALQGTAAEVEIKDLCNKL